VRLGAWLVSSVCLACVRPIEPEPIASPEPAIAVSEPAVAASAAADPGCEEDRRSVLAAIRQSRARPCGSDDECVIITSPRSGESSLGEVVHVVDAAILDARARKVLDDCGAVAIWDHRAGYVDVDPRCREGTCAAEEWSVAPLE
jgi:hypothetical protein